MTGVTKMPKRQTIFTYALFSIVFILCVLYFAKNTDRNFNHVTDDSYTLYEKAKIIQIIDESIEKDPSIENLYKGFQEVKVKILSGEHKDEFHVITNYMSTNYNVYCKVGNTIIVSVDTANPDYYVVTLYNYYRAPVLYALFALFIGSMLLISGKKGLRATIGIVFALASIVYLFIPMIYNGCSPIFASILISIMITIVTLYLLNGWHYKTFIAILGTSFGVIVAGSLAIISGYFAHISGLQTNEAELLVVIARERGMHVQGLLFSGILIASLGAIMDVAMSIASALYEVNHANKQISKKDLFLSGIHIGQDMIGTMSNTLILAFTGSSLNTLILLYSYNIGFTQLINMDLITIEIIQGISGSIGIILTVPITAFIASRFIKKE